MRSRARRAAQPLGDFVRWLNGLAFWPIILSGIGGVFAWVIGLYGQTTIEIASPFGMALWLLVPTVAAVGVALRHFIPPGGDKAQLPHWHFKRERPALWLLTGIAGPVFIGAVCALFLYPIIAALPEHTGSEVAPVEARVVEVRPVHGARTLCRTRIVLELPGGKVEDVCLSTAAFASKAIAAFDPVVNEKVQVNLRSGPFGVSIRRISRGS
jgi:hypothetical protein